MIHCLESVIKTMKGQSKLVEQLNQVYMQRINTIISSHSRGSLDGFHARKWQGDIIFSNREGGGPFSVALLKELTSLNFQGRNLLPQIKIHPSCRFQLPRLKIFRWTLKSSIRFFFRPGATSPAARFTQMRWCGRFFL